MAQVKRKGVKGAVIGGDGQAMRGGRQKAWQMLDASGGDI